MTGTSTQVLAVSKHWKHHSTSGGFDRLLAFVDWIPSVRMTHFDRSWQWRSRTLDRRWQRPTYSLLYEYGDFLAERWAFSKARSRRAEWVYYLYGDEQLNWGLVASKGKLRMSATFHLPWNRTQERFEQLGKQFRQQVDVAVAVSSELADDLTKVWPSSRVHYIPHGIDTGIFAPSQTHPPAERLRLLTVGEHMRDLELLHRILDWARLNSLPIDFTYVGPAFTRDRFYGCDNLTFLTRISEEELLSEYRKADALLLPVTASTANNALLEALACGLPVISTNTSGIVDYMDSTCGWLVNGRETAPWFELLQHLAYTPRETDQKRSHARRRGESYSWQVVANQYKSVLEA